MNLDICPGARVPSYATGPTTAHTYEFHFDEVAAGAAGDAQDDGTALRRHHADSELVAPRVRQLVVRERVDDQASAVTAERVCHALYNSPLTHDSTARRYASAVYAVSGVCLSVSALYKSPVTTSAQ